MKKILNSLLATAFVFIALLTFNSCTKSGGTDPKPNPGGGTNPPAIPATPSLNAYFTSQFSTGRPWSGGSDTCIYSSDLDATVKMNGSSEVTSPIILNSITSPISFQLSATRTVNGQTSTPKLKDMYTSPYGQDTTYRCSGIGLKGYGEWKNTSTTQSVNGGTSTPGPIDLTHYIFYPNGERRFVGGGLSHWQESYSGGYTYINLGDVGNQPNPRKQESLNGTTMVFSHYSADGATLYIETFTKQN